jgi:HSP20 family protein
MQRTGFPSQVFGSETLGGDDYELYEEDGEFVLTVDMPGFEREEIDLAWDDGVLNVAADHVDEERGRKKTYHRRFRFPKDIDEDAITARYENGVLEVTLPTLEETAARGKAIPIEG